ncbi:MAG TPA: flotillin family protein [Planctomycetes bacterium]|nr:flotillin family protein [Planctomycetota bacterium]
MLASLSVYPVLAQNSILGGSVAWGLIPIAIVLVLFALVVALSRRYKRCPSNRILVLYGKTRSDRAARPIHGGGVFVMPIIQDYQFLSLDPMQIEIPLEGALSIENIRVSVPSVFTVAIGTEPEVMTNAAIRLLGLSTQEIMKQAEDIIFGQLRQVIASMRIEEINRDRDIFLSSVQSSLEPELRKIGLVLINVNIKDITDESGYIEAIGRKAAALAINQAEVDVAEQQKMGAIGIANAERERAIQVAEYEKTRDIGTKAAEQERAVSIAELEKEELVGQKKAKYEQEALIRDQEREMRIRVAQANAEAVEGENEAKAKVAITNADLKMREAEAFERSESRSREANAAVLEAQYRAEARAAAAEAEKIEAEKRAQLEAVSRAEKAKTIVDAEAAAAMKKIAAEAEAAAIFAKMEARARGEYELLAKKGEGLKQIVQNCGGSQEAFQMLMLEHLDHLSETAAKAIANIKFDKVIVWDGGQNGEGSGNATSNFLRGLGTSLPPMLQIMKDIGGIEMPDYFGRLMSPDEPEKTIQPQAAQAPDAPEGDPEKVASVSDGTDGPDAGKGAGS